MHALLEGQKGLFLGCDLWLQFLVKDRLETYLQLPGLRTFLDEVGSLGVNYELHDIYLGFHLLPQGSFVQPELRRKSLFATQVVLASFVRVVSIKSLSQLV